MWGVSVWCLCCKCRCLSVSSVDKVFTAASPGGRRSASNGSGSLLLSPTEVFLLGAAGRSRGPGFAGRAIRCPPRRVSVCSACSNPVVYTALVAVPSSESLRLEAGLALSPSGAAPWSAGPILEAGPTASSSGLRSRRRVLLTS